MNNFEKLFKSIINEEMYDESDKANQIKDQICDMAIIDYEGWCPDYKITDITKDPITIEFPNEAKLIIKYKIGEEGDSVTPSSSDRIWVETYDNLGQFFSELDQPISDFSIVEIESMINDVIEQDDPI